jgi:hypothetical protein
MSNLTIEEKNAAFDKAESKAIDYIKSHEGPRDSFVLIAQAMDLVAKGADPEVVANALYWVLDNAGRLVPEDQVGCVSSKDMINGYDY